MTDDFTLLRSYGDEGRDEAFAELVRRRIDFVYAVALRQVRGNATLAEEIAQRVFVDLARKSGSLPSGTVLTGWLYRSTQFEAVDAMRTEVRRKAREEEAQRLSDVNLSPVSSADWEGIRPDLERSINALEDVDRDAILLRFFEDKAYSEVGRSLRISEEAARKRVDRALDKLRRALAHQGITSTASALAITLADQPALAAPPALLATVCKAAAANLAPVPVAAAAGTSAFYTMTTVKSATPVALLAIAVLATAVAFHQSSVATDLSRQTAEELARIAAGEKQLADLKNRPLPAPVRSPSSAARIAAVPLSTVDSADPNYIPGLGIVTLPDTVRRMITRELDVYSDFLTGLNLTPENLNMLAAAFQAIYFADTTARQMATREGITAANSPLQFQLILEAYRRQSVAALEPLLGGDNYAKFLEWEKSRAAYEGAGNRISNVKAALTAAGAPLSADQEARFREVLVNSVAADGTVDGVPLRVFGNANGGGPSTPVTQAVLDKGSAFLSPQQVDRLRSMMMNNLNQDAKTNDIHAKIVFALGEAPRF